MSSKQYFDQVASKWDEMRTSFFPEAVREKALAVAGIKRGESASDLGAGIGFITEALLKKGVTVVAVDQSQAMLKTLQRKFQHYGNIICKVGTAENIPLEDEQVNHSFANMYLHHVENPEIAIAEMSRITKSGGKVVITDLDSHTYTFLATGQKDRWMGFNREQIKQWFEDADLEQVSLGCVNENCCACSDNTEEEAAISIFIASGVKR